MKRAVTFLYTISYRSDCRYVTMHCANIDSSTMKLTALNTSMISQKVLCYYS